MASWAGALAWRAERQFLGETRAASALEVVTRLQAVPAWLGDADLAVGLRLAADEPGALARAVAAGEVVKVYAHRGSTQYLTPAGAATALTVRAAGRQWARTSWVEFYGVQADAWPALREEVRAAVAPGALTRAELAAAISASARFGHVGHAFVDSRDTFLKPFMWQGDLRFGPDRDGDATLASFDGVPGWTGVAELDDAGPAVVEGYLAAYGPATEANLAYWLGAGLSAGRKRIASWLSALRASGRVVELHVDETPAFALDADADAIESASGSPALCLVPGYDQWVLGPGTADPHVIAPERRALATRGAALVLEGGRVRGIWRRAGSDVEVSWFAEHAPPAREALERAARGRVAGADAEVRLAEEVSR